MHKNRKLNKCKRCANCVLLIAFFIGINYRSSFLRWAFFFVPRSSWVHQEKNLHEIPHQFLNKISYRTSFFELSWKSSRWVLRLSGHGDFVLSDSLATPYNDYVFISKIHSLRWRQREFLACARWSEPIESLISERNTVQ